MSVVDDPTHSIRIENFDPNSQNVREECDKLLFGSASGSFAETRYAYPVNTPIPKLY